MADAPPIDLSTVSSEDLRAELERRKAAAKAKGRPLRFATKAEWARAKADELRATLVQVNGEYRPGSRGGMRKAQSQDALRKQIDKFEGLASLYERKGL